MAYTPQRERRSGTKNLLNTFAISTRRRTIARLSSAPKLNGGSGMAEAYVLSTASINNLRKLSRVIKRSGKYTRHFMKTRLRSNKAQSSNERDERMDAVVASGLNNYIYVSKD